MPMPPETAFAPGDRVQTAQGTGTVVALPAARTISVKLDGSKAFGTQVVNYTFVLGIQVHVTRLDDEYKPKFCPSCEEEDYFMEGDYLCGPCRDLLYYLYEPVHASDR